MRLIELAANKSSFKTVKFNKTGISLIVGRKVSKNSGLKETYNGVGKSLIISLVHYCLGSDSNSEFDKHLPGWAFTLTFEHGGEIHRSTRKTGKKCKPVLNGNEISLAGLKRSLTSMGMFELPKERVNSLTFKALLAFFLRPRKSSYICHNKTDHRTTDYQSVLYQSFLLGLDYHLVVEKYRHITDLRKGEEIRKRYAQDEYLREFYLGSKDVEVELRDLEAEISRRKRELSEFKVADDYAERQRRANEKHNELTEATNEIVLLENAIKDIELALQFTPDVPPERVVNIYKEAKIALPKAVVKRLKEVEEFYCQLKENRSKRLGAELVLAKENIDRLEDLSAILRANLNSELRFLNAHCALDEYAENSAKISELKARESRIKDYRQLLSKAIEDIQNIKLKLAEKAVETSKYIRSVQPQLDDLMNKFREFASELYGNAPSGLTVRNDDGSNQTRFDIEVHIQNDASDGIQEGKIFCFDLLLLSLQQRHNMEFIFHDNRLFSEMDVRQRYTAFRLADKVSRELGLQYIANINQDVLNSIREVAKEDFDRLFTDSTILELTDEQGSVGKLLGIQVDMNYA